jgi:hypothetical protein
MITVYAARDEAGRLRFVGCTRNFDRRAGEHATRGWTLQELANVEDMDTALGLEQMMIDLARNRAPDPGTR